MMVYEPLCGRLHAAEVILPGAVDFTGTIYRRLFPSAATEVKWDRRPRAMDLATALLRRAVLHQENVAQGRNSGTERPLANAMASVP